ncbi:tetratricopeptide repeat protein [Nodosilinea sp. FACHB-131]|uniref:TPR end-of-group domain-containing protein n=1 Tax=Cyanophyceae TaxID=3028117 RepID=UPI001683F367|nr:tetratricopeptide repeat protein [Nodosilinea sp. FACHB-131]
MACFSTALALQLNDPNSLYNKACCYGLQGNADNALQALQAAIALDPQHREMFRNNTDSDPIRTDKRFQALVEGS